MTELKTSGDFPIVIDEASKNGLNKAMNLIKDNRDFCLSDKQIIPDKIWGVKKNYYWEKDVKEFVRRLKEELFFYPKQLSDNEMIIIIDKLCGEKLL